MLERQKLTELDTRRPRWVFMLALFLPLLMAALLFMVFTETVQANALLARPASTLPPSVPPEAYVPSVAPQREAALPKNPLRGIASWYGNRFYGRVTASGETYDMYAMTACNNTLPFGTMVRVVNLKNHRSVVVRINDRGSLLPGRIIDLSYAAADRLQILHDGLAQVKLEVLSHSEPQSGN